MPTAGKASHAVAAPDKFRGTLNAGEAAGAMARGAEAAGWSCTALPLADGGEGTLDALGGPNRVSRVTGPLGDPVEAGWRLEGETAFVEMAQASGLQLAGGAGANDALRATTRGTGELVVAAARGGARRIVVGVGGSATTDGGLGALEALDGLVPFADHGLEVQVACDVTTAFTDAAAVFAPQKGASPEDVESLTARLRDLLAAYEERFGRDVAALAGGGAAGGLAGGLAAAGASLSPGFELVAGLLGLDDALARADLVLTGEGRLDATSFAGKVVGGIVARCTARGIPVVAVVGDAAPETRGRIDAVSLVERFGPERALHDTAACVSLVVEERLGSRAPR
jgi:glycerate kinase